MTLQHPFVALHLFWSPATARVASSVPGHLTTIRAHTYVCLCLSALSCSLELRPFCFTTCLSVLGHKGSSDPPVAVVLIAVSFGAFLFY